MPTICGAYTAIKLLALRAGALWLLHLRRPEQVARGKAGGIGDAGIARHHGGDDGAVDQQRELMGQHFRLGRAHLSGELFDMRQHHLLVAQRDAAELLRVLVVLGDRVDEGAAVEAFLAEPALQRRKNPLQLRLRVAAAIFHRADEPFAPRLAFALQHGMHEVGLRSEQFVERGLGGAGLVDDGVDAGGVDAVLAEQMRRRAEQATARGLLVACSGTCGDGLSSKLICPCAPVNRSAAQSSSRILCAQNNRGEAAIASALSNAALINFRAARR